MDGGNIQNPELATFRFDSDIAHVEMCFYSLSIQPLTIVEMLLPERHLSSGSAARFQNR